jgi:hypothetical protein
LLFAFCFLLFAFCFLLFAFCFSLLTLVSNFGDLRVRRFSGGKSEMKLSHKWCPEGRGFSPAVRPAIAKGFTLKPSCSVQRTIYEIGSFQIAFAFIRVHLWFQSLQVLGIPVPRNIYSLLISHSMLTCVVFRARKGGRHDDGTGKRDQSTQFPYAPCPDLLPSAKKRRKSPGRRRG